MKDMYGEECVYVDILNNRIELDQPCYYCTNELEGWRRDALPTVESVKEEYLKGKYCEHCNNRRFILTTEGQAIINLLERHKND